MDEKLTIENVKEILDITYPTALKMARNIGTLDPSASPRGKWFFNAGDITEILKMRIERAEMGLQEIRRVLDEAETTVQ